MTQEDKRLLLTDILPRQLYGVKAHYRYYDFVGGSERLIKEGDGVIKSVDISLGNPIYIDGHHVEIENIKPYLRPLSSMTEEEEQYILHTWGEDHFNNGIDLMYDNYMMLGCAPDFIDWLNEHHFDYRRLIEKGLALEAPKGMYKFE